MRWGLFMKEVFVDGKLCNIILGVYYPPASQSIKGFGLCEIE